MSEETTHLAMFDEIDQAAKALDALRDLGIQDRDMSIISGVPYSDRMLGRPMSWSMVPKLAVAGFVLGLVLGILMNIVTPLQYPIIVGGMPLVSIPTSIVLTFETSMLGLLAFTFLGVIWESAFPSFGPKEYRSEISDGQIAVVFTCPPEIHTRAHDSLAALGANWVHRTEAVPL
jgi:hypothetical protein